MAPRMMFDQELVELNSELVKMSKMVEKAITDSFEALNKKDYALAKMVIHGDRNVDEMERKIESRCLSLMLRQQPVARDLRHISTALKVVTDLERIGDHAADIAQLTIRMSDSRSFVGVKHLPAMADSVKIMLRDAIHAFIERDTQAAEQIEQRDDIIDAYFDKVKNEVVKLLQTEPSQSDMAVDLLMIAKYLERIGDHAVNVCEWTEFSDMGTLNSIPIL